MSVNVQARRRHQGPVWEEPPGPAAKAGKGIVLVLVVAVILVPLYSIVLTSFSNQAAINEAGGLVTVPKGLTLEAYRQIFTNQLVTHSLLVSLVITVVGTVLSMVVSVLCAYGLSRRGSFAHRSILMFLVVTMFFSGGLIPSFLVVTALGGYGQYWTMILPLAVSVFNILVLRAFFSSTAPELIDAARIDGAGEWRTLWSVVMPTSRPVLAVITLFYAVGYWNSFFNALLYLPDNGKWPLQMILYTYTLQGSAMPGTGTTGTGQYAGHQQIAHLSLQMAVVTLTLIPIVLAYPFVQRHFTKGMLTGAIKG
ncbi:carbohydrate ABC transporter permease [Dactylosporangium sp. AC04546]|uniref:carbohydrate ABC transporter permease n=1 Tax=Dactylosporangium sp. AC04546 TaxID=2862460 RepID=UPI001EDE74B7|nr:carbohydrate ABC transporter permease [Dactylosporangium sp. AC04546]WVK81371.1 carbohydrate ABC transporter permease [Dactylosporangium sp. AC04546]